MDNKEAILSLVSTVSTSLEKKKTEFTNTRGAIDGVRELQKTHTTFIEKSKSDLKVLVSEGKINQEIANFVASWLGKSSKVIEDFLVAAKTNYDSKSGEVITLSNVLQLLKQTENNLALPQPQIVVPQPPVSLPTPVTEPAKEDKRSYKSRLKKSGVLAKTVERLKKSRSKKSEESSEDQ